MKSSIIHRLLLFAIALATIGFQSCVKDSNSFVVTNPGPAFNGNIKNLYINVKKDVVPETFVIDPFQENIVTTSTGMKVSIPANSFRTGDGKAVSGEVTISIYILTKKSEWVRFAQYSNTSDLLINWYKTLSVRANSNGNTLVLAEGAYLTIQLPEENPSADWKLFTGQYEATRAFFAQVSSTGYNYKTWDDNGKEVKGLEFPVYNLNWTGIGTILNNPPQNEVVVNLPDNFREFNTAVIAVCPTDNVIYYLKNVNISSSSYRGLLHTNKDITLLVLSEQGNNSFYGAKDYYQELTPGIVIDKTPSAKSVLEIEEYINAL